MTFSSIRTGRTNACRHLCSSVSPRRKERAFPLVWFAALALLAWLPAATVAQEPPGEAEIAATLDAELPAWWSIETVDIQASINDGDAVEPRWRQRFVADASPEEALFAAAPGGETVGPFRVLIPMRATTEGHRLYGIAQSTLERGEWVTTLALENSVDGLGEPRSLFAGPVVAAGSEEAERVAASLVNARELVNTVTEGLARAAVDDKALRQLAAETGEAFEAANRGATGRAAGAIRGRTHGSRSGVRGRARDAGGGKSTTSGGVEGEPRRRERRDRVDGRRSGGGTRRTRRSGQGASGRIAGTVRGGERAAVTATAEVERAVLEEENRRRLGR